jgi:hypothetical protein
LPYQQVGLKRIAASYRQLADASQALFGAREYRCIPIAVTCRGIFHESKGVASARCALSNSRSQVLRFIPKNACNVHVAVDDLQRSIGFYSELFAAMSSGIRFQTRSGIACAPDLERQRRHSRPRIELPVHRDRCWRHDRGHVVPLPTP